MTHENKFGLFIHWGLYSIGGLHEQSLARYALDRREYEAQKDAFNPQQYNPEEWVLLAKNAGMKYICFTAKHHDGFCMWDTKYTDYNVMNTPYGRDVLKMLSDACRKHGMLLSIYYSNPDWHHECAYNPSSTHQWSSLNADSSRFSEYKDFIKNQIRELLTNYGKIYTLFWDIPPGVYDPSINALAKSLQPDVYINDRGFSEGDFSTPERECDTSQTKRFSRMTEACNSLGTLAWGYKSDEIFYSKSALSAAIASVMARGGSYLLNVGPQGNGKISPEYEKRIIALGDWYNRMEHSLESHEDTELDYGVDGAIAVKKNGKTYFHFPNGLLGDALIIKNYPSIPKNARILNTDRHLTAEINVIPRFDGAWVQEKNLVLRGIDVDSLAPESVAIEIEW